jgi:hypothetical protein
LFCVLGREGAVSMNPSRHLYRQILVQRLLGPFLITDPSGNHAREAAEGSKLFRRSMGDLGVSVTRVSGCKHGEL